MSPRSFEKVEGRNRQGIHLSIPYELNTPPRLDPHSEPPSSFGQRKRQQCDTPYDRRAERRK